MTYRLSFLTIEMTEKAKKYIISFNTSNVSIRIFKVLFRWTVFSSKGDDLHYFRGILVGFVMLIFLTDLRLGVYSPIHIPSS